LSVQADDSQCLEAGPVVSLEHCNDSPEQRWRLDAQGRIDPEVRGECLKASFGSTWSIGTVPCDTTSEDPPKAEQWSLVGAIRSAASDKCLALLDAELGTVPSLQPCRGGDRQVFARVSTGQLVIDGKCIQGAAPGHYASLARCVTPGDQGSFKQLWAYDGGNWVIPGVGCLGTDDSGVLAQMIECHEPDYPWRFEGY
jgi:hypothetical protein